MQDVTPVINKFTQKDKWIRALYMIVFLILGWVGKTLALLIMLFQFIYNLFCNKSNDNLLKFSNNLNFYLYQILLFLTYNSDEKPYPFSAWPNKKEG